MENNQTTSANKAPQKPNSKKGLIIGLSIGGGVLFALIITLIVLAATVWSGPSKTDYRAAAQTMRSLAGSYNSANTSLKSYASGLMYGYSSASSKDQFVKAFDKYKEDAQGLEGMKALGDDEVKKAYDAFKAKNEKFVTYVDTVTGSLDEMGEVVGKCKASNYSSSVYAGVSNPDEVIKRFDKAISPCKTALKNLEGARNQIMKKFASDMSSSIVKMRGVLADMVKAAKARNISKVYSLQSGLLKEANALRSSSANFAQDFRQDTEANEVKDELNALGRLISEKAQ